MNVLDANEIRYLRAELAARDAEIEQLQEALAHKETRITTLREALTPFSIESLHWGEKDADDILFFWCVNDDGSCQCPAAFFTAADLHRARAVLVGEN